MKKRLIIWIVVSLFFSCHNGFAVSDFKGKKLAVTCYLSRTGDARFLGVVQGKVEEILADNGISVLDEDKAEELQNGYHLLEDPTVVVTAELLMEMRETYQIDGIINLYVDYASSAGIADFFSATGSVSLRLVEGNANVTSAISNSMGVVGNPASDGISEPTAIRNALQRATDDVMKQLDMEIFMPAEPRRVNPVLISSESKPTAGITFKPPENESSLAGLADLHAMTWQKEKATCTSRSPDGNYVAVAGYIWSQSMHTRRTYGSRIHIVDLKTRKTVQIFDFSELGVPKRHEKASKEILATTFLANWRFLVALNGNEIVFWDVERGKELSRIIHGHKANSAAIGFARIDNKNYVCARVGNEELFYEIGLDRGE